MALLSLRRGVSLAFLLVALLAVGGLAAPAAAGGNNSSFTADVSLESSQGGGYGSIDCTGGLATAHTCDKDGAFDSDAVAVDYEGFTGGGPAPRRYGFGDDFTVTVLDRETEFAFTCEFDASPSGNPCPVSSAPA